jgi:hypothetical protein
MSPATVSSWPTGHQPRPGFKLLRCKQKPGGAVWWIVEREGDTTPMKSLSAVGASRTVGFGSCLTVEAVACLASDRPVRASESIRIHSIGCGCICCSAALL